MSTILLIRLEADVKTELDKLAHSSNRSQSLLVAEAIAAYVEAENCQVAEIERGIRELDASHGVRHEEVKEWLQSWRKKREYEVAPH